MQKAYADVLAFSRAFGAHVRDVPSLPPADVVQLRTNLVSEEYREFLTALFRGDLPGLADGAADLIYVVLGTLIAHGIDPTPVWDAVHEANMKKTGMKRADGKIMKGEGFKHPDIEGLLRAQGWEGGDR